MVKPNPHTSRVQLSSAAIVTPRTNLRFQVQQMKPTPMKGSVLYLNRSEPKAEENQEINIEKEKNTLDKVIGRVRKGMKFEDSSGLMSEALGILFEESLNLDSKYGIASQISRKISSGRSFIGALESVKETIFNKLKSSSMLGAGFSDVLNAFSVAYSELSGTKTIKQTLASAKGPTILFTEKVIPSDIKTIREHNKQFPDKAVLGLVRRGSVKDHIETLCQQNKLTSVIMKDPHFDFTRLSNHIPAVVLSAEGLGESRDLIFNPDSNILKQVDEEIVLNRCLNKGLPIKIHPPYTQCGEKITLTYATSTIEECDNPEHEGLDAGLIRTEMVVHEDGQILTEVEYYEKYKNYLSMISPNVGTIRMPDWTGDKVPEELSSLMVLCSDGPEGPVPLSGSQILLENPDILFRPHLRGALRAISEMKNGRILFPQVTNHQNAQELIDFVDEEKASLGINPKEHIQIGMMIEFTRTANDIKNIITLPGVDFISIGSNDLTNDILGTNRYDVHSQNQEYSMCHYDVIKVLHGLMKTVAEVNSKRSASDGLIDVSICGNMPSSPQFIPILIGLGFRKFCVENGVEVINKMLAMLDAKECEELITTILEHQMKPGEGIYSDFLLPFLKGLELPEHLKAKLV